MWLRAGKSFFLGLTALVFFTNIASVAVAGHKDLNGTWNLVATRSEFAGEPVIQTGTVTINDRQHNIYVSRSFNFDGANNSVSYNFTTDGRENSSIREGKTFKSKAKWDDNVLVVTTTQDMISSTEHYRMNGDGTMTLTLDRPGHKTITLFFEK